MASKLHRKKRPSREDKPYDEKNKITNRVLDEKTVEVIQYFIRNHKLDKIDYRVMEGKESAVFKASVKGKSVMVKVYKYETSLFKNYADYIEGDQRFQLGKNKRHGIKVWASKEFSNLQKAYEAGVNVPKPIARKDNVIIMEFIGEDGVPYGHLNQDRPKNPEEFFRLLLLEYKKLYNAGLVHSDFNALNILNRKEKPVIIDLSQGVLLDHRKAEEYLERDIMNITKEFERLGVQSNYQENLKLIKGNENAAQEAITKKADILKHNKSPEEHDETNKKEYNKNMIWRDLQLSEQGEEVFNKFMKLMPQGKIIDIGCGNGRFAELFLQNKYDYFGIDNAKELIRTARQDFPKGKYKEEDFHELKEGDNSFDGFWAYLSLQHTDKKRIHEALNQIKRVTKPNGIGMISMKEGQRENALRKKRYETFYSDQEFKNILKQHDFEIIEAQKMPLSPESKVQTLIYYVKNIKFS